MHPQNDPPIMPPQPVRPQSGPPMYPRNNPLPASPAPEDSLLQNVKIIALIVGSILMFIVLVNILVADYIMIAVAHAFSSSQQ